MIYLLALIRTLVTFSTVYVPRFIYTVVTYSFTLQLTFPYLVTIFVLLLLTISVSLHYFYFAKYRNLKEEPLQKGDAKELHPDVVSDTPPNFHSYLDEFLQAVRVFGFLERNVFHELARHLQTRRLIAGDTISLDSDHSFYAVIDGLVQVYAQQGTSSSGHDTGGALDDDGDLNGYQLLNEVSSGGTISSLFTILSLFTEDVPISWPEPQDEDDDQSLALALAPNRQTVSPLSLSIGTQGQGTDTDIPRFSLARRDTSSTSGSAEPSEADAATVTELDEPRVRIRPPSMSSGRATPPKWPDYRRSSSLPHDVRHGTVARAATDTTLAVIPAEAFRRLTKNFPKASAHIVQVILTRFSRVTFNVAHKYLGLTTELLRTEKVINDLACHPLPATFYEGGGMQRLRQRFAPELDTDKSSSTETDYFAYDPVASPTARNTPFLRTMPALATTKIADRVSSAPTISFKAPQTPAFPARASLSQVGAGDLFSMTRPAPEYSGLSRTASGTATPFLGPRRRGKSDTSTSPSIDLAALTMDDFDLREEVMTCLARSIGLQQPGPSGSESAEPSPAVSPATNGLGAYGSPLGPLTALGMPGVDDASSVTGQSAANMSLGAAGVVENAVEILYFSAGSTLVHAGERNAGLFFVIDGFLECFLPVEDWERDKTANMTAANGEAGMKPFLTAQPQADPRLNKGFMPGKKKRSMSSKYLFTVKRGEIAGYLSAMSGIPSYIDIRAKTDVYVGFLPAHALERLLERRPIVLLTLAKRLISLLSPLVLHIDSALDWMQVNSGQIIWREGDASDSFYIVINGRLRELDDKMGDDVEILAEYGQGDYVGELDVITGSPRNTTLHAIRDTELIRMPLTLFNAISARHPQATVQLLRMIASRNKAESRPHTIGVGHAPSLGMAHELAKNNMNLKTVGILPVSKDIPITTFAKKLQAALESIGAPTSYLDQNVVTTHLGRHAFTRVGKLKLAGWFADQEQRYRIVLYVADTPVSSPWTQTCIRQADCVLMVGFGDEPSVGEYERVVLSTKTTARKELVLLHPERTVTPGSTREWLKNRSWVHMHHHVELPGLVVPVLQTPIVPPKDNDAKAMAAFRMLKETVQSGIQRYRHLGYGYKPRPTRPDHTTDFARLARRLCGKSVGIVLGGGGARGLAHLGALRALEEQGVPIDLIGGTSIGSFIGGLYAREGDLFSSGGRAKWFSARMTNVWRILSDVTWPVIAYTTGHEFNRAIYKCFYDVHIEDMWIPFFCNTVSLNWSRIEIHDTGYAWRYIRASMTLVGLLPPLSDHGNMLVDGGYIDNLPVSTMLQKGANIVFAVDVGGVADTSPRFFGDSISGWWILLNRWNPFSESRKIPPITEIQGRLAYVSSVRYLAEAKHLPGCMYMPLPVQQYGIMDFAKFGEIQKIGLVGAREMLKLWGEQDKLPIPRADEDSKGGEEKRGKKGKRERRNSI
ncbi:patatin-domain-containing protein [Dacryopinax primogenitus]|uniref:Lysophospholipase NTE1 n=1 Tax=Dacryopinax primogenitus (strain DJM 731) TaxID=1858805 RepID=M5FUZ7_DACPD|nr:patatin-domain-containing protein [Dacryopinax primogenitus]EJU00079.1 patatin-domain-containing protein [Dacryopinax primogenitus]